MVANRRGEESEAVLKPKADHASAQEQKGKDLDSSSERHAADRTRILTAQTSQNGPHPHRATSPQNGRQMALQRRLLTPTVRLRDPISERRPERLEPNRNGRIVELRLRDRAPGCRSVASDAP